MRRSLGTRVFDLGNNIFMMFLCVITLYPYINQLAIALNEGKDTAFGGITIFPRKFTLANLELVFQNSQFFNGMFVSVSRVVVATIIVLIVTTAAAYGLSRKYLPFKNVLLGVLIIPGYISVGLVPTFILFKYLGLINNFWVYVLPRAFSFYNMLIIMSFLRGLPDELEESAIIDGANEVQVFFKIIIPLSTPVLATIALWTAVDHWNDWITTLLFVTERKLYTIQYLLMQVVKESETLQAALSEASITGGGIRDVAMPTPEAVRSATFVIATLPIMLVYPFMQRYFVKGIVLGAVKG